MKKKLLLTILVYIPAGAFLASILLVVLLKWMPVLCTPLMIKRFISPAENSPRRIEYKWTPLKRISSSMPSTVMASEDQKFLTHNGFDFEEINKVVEEHKTKGKRLRGCSTISQQTAKNCFTFCSKTWFRKAVEAYFTVLIEKIWGKRRIMEVYLNVAEMGPGIYGVEAASEYYYKIPASKLSRSDAAALTCCLPNPIRRNPAWVNAHMGSKKANIISQSYMFALPE